MNQDFDAAPEGRSDIRDWLLEQYCADKSAGRSTLSFYLPLARAAEYIAWNFWRDNDPPEGAVARFMGIPVYADPALIAPFHISGPMK